MRVGHRIIEINGQSVVAVPHERIVNLLATSVGEVRQTNKQTNKQIFRGDINRRIIVNRMYFYFVPSRIGWVADCLLVSDPHEDNANLHVPTPDWSGESSLHIMCRALLLTKECQLKEDVEEEKAQSSFENIQYCKHTYLCRKQERKHIQ